MSNQVIDRPQTSKHTEAHTILQRAVCLTLRCTYQGNYRKADLGMTVTAATGFAQAIDKGVARQVKVSKHLVDSKWLTKADAAVNATKAMLRAETIPMHRVFGDNTYLIPVATVQRIDAMLHAAAAAVAAEGRDVATHWHEAIAEQAIALGSLFDVRQYPTADEVERAWSVDWSYVSFAAPERLEQIDRALFESTQQKYEARMSEAFTETRTVLREMLRQVVVEVAKKLAPAEDGKPRVFRNTILDGLAGFLENFHLRDIADDDELRTVVERLRRLTSGVDPEQLREIDQVRESVLAGVRQAADVLDTLVATGRRGISFNGLD